MKYYSICFAFIIIMLSSIVFPTFSLGQGIEYKVLATNKTSTMQKELQQSGDMGFAYKAQTVFKTAFGGKKVVTILERDLGAPVQRYEYKLLATSRTSTMEKELKEAGSEGYEFLGMSVGKTIAGNEVLAILQRLVKH
jgi:hypothetical protein